VPFNAGADGFLERVFNVLADDKDELAKSGAKSIVDRIIDDGFTTRTDRINLLEAAIAVAHASGQNEQSRRCHQFHQIS
jgi:hypothetical protein